MEKSKSPLLLFQPKAHQLETVGGLLHWKALGADINEKRLSETLF